MDDIDKQQEELQRAARELVEKSELLPLLRKLGEPIQTGSSMTGLMVYPDIDFAVLSSEPDLQAAIDLVPVLTRKLHASHVQVTDFAKDSSESAAYYVGIMFPFQGTSWHIDATVSRKDGSDPSDAYKYLLDISSEQRGTILKLKKELIDTKRYAGSRSQPPFTFRSLHLYEGVIKGGAKTIKELENYFR